ncbi:hypothetical protein ACFL4V_00925 [Candidatus Latescibacterota bacterium]
MKFRESILKTYSELDSAEKLELRISYSLKIIVLFTIIISIIELNFFLIASSVMILLFSALPALVERKFRIILPVEVEFALTTFIFLHFILGEASNYYIRFWWFDELLHISSGILIGLVGFVIIYFFLYTNRVEANPLIVVVFSVSFSLAAGAIWEIFEFLMDLSFGFTMQKSGIVDTMTDLMVDFLGAFIVGIGVYRYLKKDEDGVIKTLVNRFIQYNLKKKQIILRKKYSKTN